MYNKGGKMKKLLILGIACVLGAHLAQAETVSGRVTGVLKNTITVRTEEGDKITMQTTDNTNYREKKVSRKGKMHKGKMQGAETYYRPMVEEEDWVEITYTPTQNDMQSAEIQEVIVYDD